VLVEKDAELIPLSLQLLGPTESVFDAVPFSSYGQMHHYLDQPPAKFPASPASVTVLKLDMSSGAIC
jgi:hypothetical protein